MEARPVNTGRRQKRFTRRKEKEKTHARGKGRMLRKKQEMGTD